MIHDEEAQLMPRDGYDFDEALPYSARDARNKYEEQVAIDAQFVRPTALTYDEMRRERYVKYGIALVGTATIVTVLDALSGMF
jgi:hypothetical protein